MSSKYVGNSHSRRSSGRQLKYICISHFRILEANRFSRRLLKEFYRASAANKYMPSANPHLTISQSRGAASVDCVLGNSSPPQKTFEIKFEPTFSQANGFISNMYRTYMRTRSVSYNYTVCSFTILSSRCRRSRSENVRSLSRLISTPASTSELYFVTQKNIYTTFFVSL